MVGVLLGRSVRVGVDVFVGVLVAVAVEVGGIGVSVCVGVAELVGVCVAVSVEVGGIGVSVLVGVKVAVLVAVCVSVEVLVGVKVGVSVGLRTSAMTLSFAARIFFEKSTWMIRKKSRRNTVQAAKTRQVRISEAAFGRNRRRIQNASVAAVNPTSA